MSTILGAVIFLTQNHHELSHSQLHCSITTARPLPFAFYSI
jgi:hypothetical protein